MPLMAGVSGAALGDTGRAEVERVLSSATFNRSPRLARLLQYLCAKCLQGQAEHIKEYDVAIEVLERPESFNPAEDAIVRVEVHRLRKKLREYYETEGSGRALRIVIPLGRYAPEFVPASQATGLESAITAHEAAALPPNGHHFPPALTSASDRSSIARLFHAFPARPYKILSTVAVLALLGVFAVVFVKSQARGPAFSHPQKSDRASASASSSLPLAPVAAAPAGQSILILCGRSKTHADSLGNLWGADRYFEGGTEAELPRGFIARAADQELFRGARTGDFSYHIPLAPGMYQLHLYFVETMFGPGTAAGGGENSRVFHVAAEGRRILSEFDIISDAGGPNIADERVFKNISPGPDGMLHLRFMTQRSPAMVSGIKLEPAKPNRLNPIRIHTRDKAYTDAAGRLWRADNFWSGGQSVPVSERITGTDDPDLYSTERYGHFSYAIPVAAGEYAVTLHFAETYWGLENPGGGGATSREFDVLCNGVTLLRNFDVYKEVGGSRALMKTFHGLKPNAQGKLTLTFAPIRNYATLRAIEVVDES